MKQINLITFSKADQRPSSILKSHSKLLDEINKSYDVKYYNLDEIDKLSNDIFTVLFMTKTGIDSLLIHHFERLPHPIIMLADEEDYSLPAALEVSSWLRQQGFKCEIVYGTNEYVIERLNVLNNCFTATHSLNGLKIGIIGNLSPALISSGVDYLLAKRRWGIDYADIPIDVVYEKYNKISKDSVQDEVNKIVKDANDCQNCRMEDITDSIRLYHAISSICDEYKLQAVTLNCSKLYEKINVTGCLTLSLLNNEGIVACCEGDLQSIFTMIVSKALTGNSGFMANVSGIDTASNEVVFTHCSVSTNLTSSFNLCSHYESKRSVGIQGFFKDKKVATIVRCGGECLDSYFASCGIVIDKDIPKTYNSTQICIKLKNPVSYFLNNSLGNHHIILFGDYEEELNTVFQANSCKRLE
jgi:L-fucose isomerase-like protein